MSKPTIILTPSEHGYMVHVGDKFAGSLCPEEALGVIAHVLCGADWRGQTWLKNYSEHVAESVRHEQKMVYVNAERDRIEQNKLVTQINEKNEAYERGKRDGMKAGRRK